MSDHLLHLSFGEYGPIFRLTCHHGPDDYPVLVDPPDGERDPLAVGECWARSWWDDLVIDEIVWGDNFPEALTFPLPVAPEWCDGLCLSYDGEAS